MSYKKGLQMKAKRKDLSTQRELVSQRQEISYRPVSKLYNKIKQISKKRGISMNRFLNEIIEVEVNTLA